ncbi:DUF5684 domain-containing protein [Microbacterium sp. P04]|uniref:DUF5684 domain-containing protein n=1 Tax=Microbacterium sp. P04 TaxID=3366947 RepID=UPI003746BDD6
MNDSIPIIAGVLAFVVSVALYVWLALALSAVFRKAGEASWQGWVPLYNQAVILRLGGFSPWLIFVALVPIFGWIAYPVIHIIACHRINRAFGHGVGMTVVAALFLVIWASILGFGSSRWIGAEPAAGPRRTEGGPAFPPVPQRTPAAPAPSGPFAAAAPAASPVGQWAPPTTPPAPAVALASAASPPAPAAPAAAPLPPVPPAPPRRSSFDADLDDAVDPEDRVAPAPSRTGSFLPPPPSAPVAPPTVPVERVAPIESVPTTRASAVSEPPRPEPLTQVPHPATPAVPPAPEPVVVTSAPEPEPWIPEPEPAPWIPARTPEPERRSNDPGAFPELSEAVSAVIGAPDAGAPRSARSSVSALYAQPEIPDTDDDAVVDDARSDGAGSGGAGHDGAGYDSAGYDGAAYDDALDQTIIARRRRIPWSLIPPQGDPVDISSEVVILGRRPAPDPAHPGAQLISISDETRTVSKTHAKLELRGDTWYVTDLGSTNGVLFATLMGTEIEVQPGQQLEAGERFFLGDAEVRLKRGDA